MFWHFKVTSVLHCRSCRLLAGYWQATGNLLATSHPQPQEITQWHSVRQTTSKFEREDGKRVTHHFCFKCEAAREKWQQQAICCWVLRKERRLTHRGGAWVNEHTSKRRPTPSGFQVGQFQPQLHCFASNSTTFRGERLQIDVWFGLAKARKERKELRFILQPPHVKVSKFVLSWKLPQVFWKQGQVWHVAPLYGNQMWRVPRPPFFFLHLMETPQGVLSWGGSGLSKALNGKQTCPHFHPSALRWNLKAI